MTDPTPHDRPVDDGASSPHDRPVDNGASTHHPLPVPAILAAAFGLGVAGDQLLRTSAGPGLGFFLLLAGLAASIWIVSRAADQPLSREATLWIGVGLLCAAALLWRGSQLLRLGTFLAACTAFTLPALDAGRAWIRRAGIGEVVEAVLSAGLHAGLAGLRLVDRRNWDQVGSDEARGAVRTVARSAVGGLLLALVPLVVFGALFISADQVFATLVGDWIRIDLEQLAGHAAATAALTWLSAGFLVGTVTGTRIGVPARIDAVRPTLGVAQVATAMGLVALLFLVFVGVQFRYLFGGGSFVEVTPGLTYAAYARAGFFQLVVAVGLALPWLLGTHALLRDDSPRARAVFRGFAGLQVVLLLAIVASAAQRMLVYQTAYGLTEDRVVATAILGWLTVLVLWFGATVLSGRRDRFAFGGLVTAYALVAGLHLADPAGLVARQNLERMDETGEIDAPYLAQLGADAVPVLLARLDDLPEADRCVVATRLLRRWGPERPAEWKAFNRAESRARSAVEGRLTALRSLAAGVDGEGTCATTP